MRCKRLLLAGLGTSPGRERMSGSKGGSLNDVADSIDQGVAITSRCLWVKACNAASPIQKAADRLARVSRERGVDSPERIVEARSLPEADPVGALVEAYTNWSAREGGDIWLQTKLPGMVMSQSVATLVAKLTERWRVTVVT